MTRGENTYYYMADALGSVRNIVESDEDVANTYDYYGFGDYLAASETVTSPYRYTGREYETGGVCSPYYYRNRYYTAALGIFASRDAMWADTGRGWGYVGNGPVVYNDPYGLGGVTGTWAEGDDPEANDGALQRVANSLYAMLCPPPSYGYLDCLGTCIEKNDPLNWAVEAVAGAFMPFKKTWPVTRLFTYGKAIPGKNKWTNPLSMISTLFRMGGRSMPRTVGRAGAKIKLGGGWCCVR